MRKIMGVFIATAMAVSVLAGCSSSTAETTAAATEAATTAAAVETTTAAASSEAASTEAAAAGGAMSGTISVYSRESGSGTRGAFIELLGIEEKDADGKKVDKTIDTAAITNSTQVMMTNVEQDINGIGYISLGSMNDTVKALKVDGAEATVDNIKSDTYKVSRPFNIATLGDPAEGLCKDFIDFIMSQEGQAVVEENGYISVADQATAYAGSKPAGSITIAGSSSVTPVMEKLVEAYKAVNPDANIDVQQSDSTTGMTSTIDGACDIGMASRELKDEELSAGLKNTVIAKDGIAIIVNKDNTLTDIKSEQVKDIYTGAVAEWSEIK